MLMWHYRSREESLIAFSNYHFYDNRLYTFPNSSARSADNGISFHHVAEGVYRRGAGGRDNPVEAREVVKGIIEHFSSKPDKSLGIVTFSQAQRQTIENELDRALLDNRHLQPFFDENRSNPFFVKNLETVQGDERDHIFFSVGYGHDEAGKFIMNFGPLNREGGERRLNVAVTRARYGVRVYASIQPEDIDLDRTRSRGAQLLRSYMEVARDGLKSIYTDLSIDPDADFDSPFEEAVHRALTATGLEVRKQIGVSNYRIDLAVVDPNQPGKYLLGIECDGAMYHSAATARDRDRLRQEVLEGLGWTIHRIWSHDWWRSQSKEIEKVIERLEEIKKSPKVPAPVPKASLGWNRLPEQPVLDLGRASVRDNQRVKPKGSIPYQAARITPR